VPAPRHPIEVRSARSDDLVAVEAIAATAFTTGRFLLDPRLPAELSHRRYASWVRSSFAGTAQRVMVAELAGALVGFFIVEQQAEGRVYWHLTAIDPGWQGKGIGGSLWQTMLRRHAAEGATMVETTISAHNLAALNMYARLGFTFPSASVTLHRLLDEPGMTSGPEPQ
jgi:GNAT superfamily N-acetyltransferase